MGAFVRWRAVCVDNEVFIGLVDGLQRRARAHVDEAADGHDVALGRLSEIHRQATGEHDKCLADRDKAERGGLFKHGESIAERGETR